MKALIAKYSKKGIRITPQRIAILEYLEGNTTHPTAETIYQHIKKNYPTVSFATVYNTLQMLKERGEIVELNIDSQKKHFDPNITPHNHIICVRCNEIRDIFVDYSKDLKLPEQISEEYKILRSDVNFFGLCKKCLSLENKKASEENKKHNNRKQGGEK